MRPLTLHVSALTDNEYDLYTRLFIELADDCDVDPRTINKPRSNNFFEHSTVGVREARAFLRGRYTDLSPSTVDSIFKIFSPELARTDTLNGGQFFAALRLLSHVSSGKELDPSLAFVQIHPDPHPSRPQSPLQAPPPRAVLPPPPPRPQAGPRRRTTLLEPDNVPDQPAPDAPPLAPPPSKSAPASPQSHRRSVSSSVSSVEPLPLSRNPFVTGRSKTEGGPTPLVPPKLPPLPPRKPTSLQPPPRHLSVSSTLEGLAGRKPPPPPIPPFPAATTSLAPKTSSLVSPLIQSSLQASKVAQLSRKVEEKQKEPIVHVLKSSEPRARSSSPAKNRPDVSRPELDSLPPRPPPRRKESSSATISSTESSRSSKTAANDSPSTIFPAPAPTQLIQTNPFRARAEARSTSRSPSRPPPLHPDRKATASALESPTTPTNPRIGRSKSLHHSPTTAPPVPPPRRKRPESIQLTPTSSTDGSSLVASPHPTESSFGHKLTRHTSLNSRSRYADLSEGASPLAHIQKTFAKVGEKAQPRFEAALFKAEAGLSRKGFISHNHGAREEASLIRERSMENIELSSDDAEVDSGADDDFRRGRRIGLSGDDRWAARNEWRPL